MRVAPDRPDHSENVGVALSQNPVTAVTAATVTLYSADGLIAVQVIRKIIYIFYKLICKHEKKSNSCRFYR
ncbi:hypothetical protein PGB90_009566 [Kerria lacca]